MHETSLVKSLIQMVEGIARKQGCPKVKAVRVVVGALSSVSADHLREQFKLYARGTVAENAELLIRVHDNPESPIAYEVMLDSVDLEDILQHAVSPRSPLEKATQ